MTKSRGRLQNTKGLVDKSVMAAPPAPAWHVYRLDAGRDEQYIEFGTSDRVYQSLWRDGNLITDFVLVQQTRLKSRWRDVVKIDCCHGAAHIHNLRLNGSETTKDLQTIDGPEDILVGLEKADKLIFDHWQNNVRRWERGR